MSSTDTGRPWYAGGLAFECNGCGRCCAGPDPGYVWISATEIAGAAERLGVTIREFRKRYTRRLGLRVSLIEKGNADCIFLEESLDGRRMCAIYDVRPTQCRTWPFWRHNLTSSRAWAMAGQRCPGVNRGSLHPLEHIERERDRTG